MIVRTGNTNAERFLVDHGPTPAPTRARGAVNGTIVVPGPTRYHTRPTDEQVAASNARRATTRGGRVST